MMSGLGPSNSVLRRVTISEGKGQFWGKICAKPAYSYELPIGLVHAAM